MGSSGDGHDQQLSVIDPSCGNVRGQVGRGLPNEDADADDRRHVLGSSSSLNRFGCAVWGKAFIVTRPVLRSMAAVVPLSACVGVSGPLSA